MFAPSDLQGLPPLSDVIRDCHFVAKKSLGQNFILDLNITRKIAKHVPQIHQGSIIEIGPGPGGLTRALFWEGAQHVIAIDKDPRAIMALAPLHKVVGSALEIRQADVLSVDLDQCGKAPRQVVANLPYNVATPILMQLLRKRAHFHSFTLMFQKEVAERLVAQPRTPQYGRLSVIAQWASRMEILFILPPSVFVPAPQVHSAVVQFTPKPPQGGCSFEALEATTHRFFQNRRKMLRANLKNLTPQQEDFLKSQGILTTMRPEELTVEQFCVLAGGGDVI